MEIVLLILASLCYASGGLLMKLSQGMAKLAPTVGFLLLFLTGAVLQAMSMKRADLGVAYIVVLGLEAVIAFGFSVVLLRESASPGRIAAVLLIVAGIALLRRS